MTRPQPLPLSPPARPAGRPVASAPGPARPPGTPVGRRDHHLQRRRGRGRDHRRHGRVVDRVDRVRSRLGDRGVLGGGGSLAVLHADHERRERTALRVIAVSFFLLAAYVAVESARALVGAEQAQHSTVGLVLAAVSLVVMPLLSAAQRRTGRQLASRSAARSASVGALGHGRLPGSYEELIAAR